MQHGYWDWGIHLFPARRDGGDSISPGIRVRQRLCWYCGHKSVEPGTKSRQTFVRVS